MEEKALSYFRVKTEYTAESDNGALEKRKIEELVFTTNYTEAEALVHQITASLNRTKFSGISYEIVKTKISDVFFNEILAQENSIPGFCCNYFEEDETSGVGLYAVKVMFIAIDEKTAKEKKTTEVFYVPAQSNADATKRVTEYLNKTMSDFVIRDTKFDKAEAIYWPLDVHKDKVRDFDLN